MASQNPAKRQRKRKVRTAKISSSSESESDLLSPSSDSDTDDSDEDDHKQEKVAKDALSEDHPMGEEHGAKRIQREQEDAESQPASDSETGDDDRDAMDRETQSIATAPSTIIQAKTPESQAFEKWYMQTITKQYENDLDQLRKVPDFKESSLEVLKRALRQGIELFSEADQKVIMQGIESRKSTQP